ncbi:MAG: glycoside hydrolase [Candidatus Latescibacterota bacterium]
MTKLYVAFMWHMHQPYYRDPDSDIYLMPWVRLHATKDYLNMVAILEDFPNIHQTFNLVPSLVEQIREYVSGATDRGMVLTRRVPADLTKEEKVEILSTFFMANPERMILPHRRFRELLTLRGSHTDKQVLRKISEKFSERDWMDLQVWFNLAWITPLLQSDPSVRRLFDKASDFDAADKEEVLRIHQRILEGVIPKHQELSNRGQIEITTSPFYHPILPLLCDTGVAKESLPTTELPDRPFQAPEDASAQIEDGIRYVAETFGARPKGMWPSEGSVSSQAVALMADAGVEWIATDEEVLQGSLAKTIWRDAKGSLQNPERLYRPYRFGNMQMIFRDRVLSDRIGFVYATWPPQKAAQDMLGRLQAIRGDLAGRGIEHGLIPIILDGENCWESYPNNGIDFLRALYENLSHRGEIEAVTVGEYLAKFPPEHSLSKLHPGSWINANFRIWIGHPEDNRAWDLLGRTRETLAGDTRHFTAEHAQDAKDSPAKTTGTPSILSSLSGLSGDRAERLRTAWREIYIAEGSDWCWWYGDEHSSQDDERFDYLFRRHLARVYELLERDVPVELLQSIRNIGHSSACVFAPLELISPDVDGQWSHFYEWTGAGFIDPLKAGGAMHQTAGIIRGIYYGSDLERFYLRIDVNTLMAEVFRQGTVVLDVLAPVRTRVEAESHAATARIFAGIEDRWQEASGDNTVSVAFVDCFELSASFSDLNATAGQDLRFRIVLKMEDRELESWPRGGVVTLPIPAEASVETPW